MPKPLGLHDVINQAAKQGVSVGRYRITKEQGAEIKRIEREQGHDQALAALLRMLRGAVAAGEAGPGSAVRIGHLFRCSSILPLE
jgi:hypothetical protein